MTTGQSESIVVACAADRRYGFPLAIMLRSAVANLRSDLHLEVYAVDDGVDAADKGRIAASVAERATVHWVEPRPPALPTLFTWGGMPVTTYQKLTLGEWLPASVGKAVWLDCDLLVLQDLARLWHEPFGGCVLLAVQDERVPCVASRFGIAGYRELGLPAHAKYFNAGVLVIDLHRWRADAVGQRAAGYLARTAERVCFHDQEALNVVLADSWRALDPRWNTNPVLGRLLARREGPLAPPAAGAGGPWIAHFSGRLKPWVYSGRSEHHALYYRYVDETAWSGWRPARSCVGRAIARYEASLVRRWLYPLEQWGTWLVKATSGRRASTASSRGE